MIVMKTKSQISGEDEDACADTNLRIDLLKYLGAVCFEIKINELYRHG